MLTGRVEKKTRFEGIEYYNYLEKFGMDLSLERIISLLGAFHDPHQKYPVVLVGGTNGKGSTSSMLSSILRSAGYTCGLYLSPHVFSLEERISINGRRITFQELDEGFSEIRDKCTSEKLEITQFEAITALAYLFFQKKEVDIAVMEVGMGGRFDATNVADPILSVITNVSKDHTEHLGNDIEEIAFEKLGICRKDSPVLIGQSPGMGGYEYLLRATERISSVQFINGRDLRIKKKGVADFDYSIDVEIIENDNTRGSGLLSMMELNVRGCSYQTSNAAMAVIAAQMLGEIQDLIIPESEIRNGLKDLSITARCQKILEQPLIILDCAHNPAGIEALCRSMQSLLEMRRKEDAGGEQNIHRKINWVCSFMADKDISTMLKHIYHVATCVFLAELPLSRSAKTDSLALTASEMFEALVMKRTINSQSKKARIKDYNVFSDHRTAIIAALSNTTENDILVIAGSIYSLKFYTDVLTEFFPEIDI